MNLVMKLSANVEQNISDVQRDRNEFVLADYHMKQAYTYEKRCEEKTAIEVEEKILMILNILQKTVL
jgi:hypothetical protein